MSKADVFLRKPRYIMH